MKTTIFIKAMLLGAAVCLNANVMFAQSGLWQANGGSIVFTNRNVGIGTSAPTDKLQVAGRVNAFISKPTR